MSRPIPTGKAPEEPARANNSDLAGWKLQLEIASEVDIMGRWPSTVAPTPGGTWCRQCASCLGCGPFAADRTVAAKARVVHSATCPSYRASNLALRFLEVFFRMADRMARAEGEKRAHPRHIHSAFKVCLVAGELEKQGQADIARLLIGPQAARELCEIAPPLDRLLLEGGFPLADLLPS